MPFEERGILNGAKNGQGETADVVQYAGGVGGVLVHEPGRGKLPRDQCARQVMPPNVTDERMMERLAEIGTDADRKAHALQVISTQNGNGLEDRMGRKSRGVDERIRDGENFTGERSVRRDELAQLVQLYILIVGKLQHADSDHGKRGQAKVCPGWLDGLDWLRLAVHGASLQAVIGWPLDGASSLPAREIVNKLGANRTQKSPRAAGESPLREKAEDMRSVSGRAAAIG